MDKKSWAIVLFIIAIGEWFFPGWNGLLFENSNISEGEGRIYSIICFIGGLLLWYTNSTSDIKNYKDIDEDKNTIIEENDDISFKTYTINIKNNTIIINTHYNKEPISYCSTYKYKIEGKKILMKLIEYKNKLVFIYSSSVNTVHYTLPIGKLKKHSNF